MRKNAFTLLELLIVIVISCIVITLTIPTFQRLVRKAKAAEAKVMLRAISDAVWNYYLGTGGFPSDPSKLDITLPPSRYFFYSYNGNAVYNGAADINGDGQVDFFDFVQIQRHWNSKKGGVGYDERSDINNDGTVDMGDLSEMLVNWSFEEEFASVVGIYREENSCNVGETIAYCIIYKNKPPTPFQTAHFQTAQKMNDTWYRYYGRYRKGDSAWTYNWDD